MYKKIEKPELIIFDWDNTLVDAWYPIHFALQETLRRFNKPTWDINETKQRVHHSLRDSFPTHFAGHSLDEVTQVYRDAYKALQHTITPLANANESLELLRNQGIAMAIVSNKHSIPLNHEITVLNWHPYFIKIIGSGDIAEDKPSAKTVEAVLEVKKASPEKIWFVGDAITDVETAKNFGCISVLYGNEDYSRNILSQTNPDLHLHDHNQLIEYIKSFG